MLTLISFKAHVCVLQTALDLLDLGYPVHVLADGVSSCNREEVPIALERIRQAGGLVTTSESAAFQLQRTSIMFLLSRAQLAPALFCHIIYFSLRGYKLTLVAHHATGDSNRPNFKAFSAIIKEEKVPTKSAVETLCPLSTGPRTDTKSAL